MTMKKKNRGLWKYAEQYKKALAKLLPDILAERLVLIEDEYGDPWLNMEESLSDGDIEVLGHDVWFFSRWETLKGTQNDRYYPEPYAAWRMNFYEN